ncbi:MAG: hypothetical protein IID46_15580 [Planctomycetes bacterium]|nr:hypothetical protein [Planctomycetota bacterium]
MAHRPTRAKPNRESKPIRKSRLSNRPNEPAGENLPRQIHPKKRVVTPFRLVILGAFIIVAATVFAKLKSNRQDGAEWELKIAVGNAEAALKKGDFSTSAKEYQKACAALDVLKRNDAQEKTIRQRYKESTAAGNLLADSLFEILNKLSKEIDSDSARPQIFFETSHTNRWIVMETIVEKMEDRNGHSRIAIDFPFEIDGRPVEFEANLTAFEKLPVDRKEQEVIFAAQLQRVQLQGAEHPYWMITLQPETAFLWTDYETFQAMGFEHEDTENESETRELLAEQSRLLRMER